MLNFDQPILSNINLNEPAWKVLVYDDYGQDIITPLLSVKELRDLGVTAHLYEFSSRIKLLDLLLDLYFLNLTTGP
jgi:hypothetical protein